MFFFNYIVFCHCIFVCWDQCQVDELTVLQLNQYYILLASIITIYILTYLAQALSNSSVDFSMFVYCWNLLMGKVGECQKLLAELVGTFFLLIQSLQTQFLHFSKHSLAPVEATAQTPNTYTYIV